ncbi:MAG: HAD family hydrolase [Lachnospiraceae bacterium]|nr:HAD family hydrolase [Lachnospiraceae bacterium]
MKRPRMILFDYGQTLISEAKFDGVRGTRAVLEYAVENRHGRTAEELQRAADEMNHELGRFDPARRHLFQVEVPNHMFSSYLYESQGVRLSISGAERDRVFWDAASPGEPTPGIRDFLKFLKEQGIRTGVISNISYCGEAVCERINRLLPDNEFEFIIATSEYLYRKPNRRIFELALEKAGLAAQDVWYVGDQYECDIVGAKGAGLTPLWYIGAIDMPYTKRDDVLTVESWEEARGLFTGCGAG